MAQATSRAQWVSSYKSSPSTVLDIACATGAFLKQMKALGYEGEGIEISEEMAKWGSSHYGLTIRPESILDTKLPEKNYDIISWWGAISNVYDPLAVLRKIYSSLKDEGFFVFSFFEFWHPSRWLRGSHFMRYPSQLFNYSTSNIRLLLQKSRFQVLQIKTENQFASLEKILPLFSISPRKQMKRKLFRLPSFGGKVVAARKLMG